MIKLAAADMDGTLLDSSHALPADTAEVILALKEKGIRFAAASGRQYHSVRKIFDSINIGDDIIYIAENGGVIVDKGELIGCTPLSRRDIEMFMGILEKMPQVSVLLSGVESAYVKKGPSGSFGFDAALYCARYEELSDLLTACDKDTIVKIAVHDPDAENGCRKELTEYSGSFSVVLSNTHWVDIMAKGVDKGKGLESIGRIYDIAPHEMMCFGDYLNDLAMIKYAAESYAMENGHPDLKAAARHIAPSNDEYGVMQVLKTLL